MLSGKTSGKNIKVIGIKWLCSGHFEFLQDGSLNVGYRAITLKTYFCKTFGGSMVIREIWTIYGSLDYDDDHFEKCHK